MSRRRQTTLDFARDCAEVWADGAREQNIAYLSKTFAVTSLPYQNPGDDVHLWHRRNGNYLLKITPGGKEDGANGAPLGLPYGTIPRLLVAYVSTAAVLTKDPEIRLPSSLKQFMDQLGQKPTGGKNGSITRLRYQAERLFESAFTVRWEGDSQRDIGRRFVIASDWDLSWELEGKRKKNFILLSQDFFDEIVSAPVPLDLDAVLALSASPFRIDLYAWLTWRLSFLEHPITVPLDALEGQFGFQVADDAKGRNKLKSLFVKHLPFVREIYREADVELTKGGLLLRPSPPHVPFRNLHGIGKLAG